MERSRTIFSRLCISSPAKSDYWSPFGCVRGLMAKAKNGTRFNNSSEAVCVFNTVWECVVIQSVQRNIKALVLACVVVTLISRVDTLLFSKHDRGMFQNTGAHLGVCTCVFRWL